MTRPGHRPAATASTVRAAVGELRASWPWLADTAIPGPTALPLERHITADQAATEVREQAEDREAARLAIRDGITAAGSHADAARVGPLAARTVAVDRIRRLVERVYAHQHGTVLTWRVPDPTARVFKAACWYCEATGRTIVLPTPDNPPAPGSVLTTGQCPQCAGRCEVPTAAPCPVCARIGRCGCDRADAMMAAALDHLVNEVQAGLPPLLLALVQRIVEGVDRQIRRAARTGEVLIVLKAPCPACDNRDLVVNCTSPNQNEWAIRCRAPLCACEGAGCPCGCATRYAGRPHLWPASDGSWYDLAARLGVSPRDLLAEVMNHRPTTIGSTETGTGGRAW